MSLQPTGIQNAACWAHTKLQAAVAYRPQKAGQYCSAQVNIVRRGEQNDSARQQQIETRGDTSCGTRE